MKRLTNKQRKILAPFAAFAFISVMVLPLVVSAQTISLEVPIGIAGSVSKENSLIEWVALAYEFIVGVIGIIAAVMIMFNGIKWASAGGNAETITQCKDGIISAFSGLLIALGSFLILNYLNPALTSFEPLQQQTLGFYDVADTEDTTSCQQIMQNAGDDACTGLQSVDTSLFKNVGKSLYPKMNPSAASDFDAMALDFKLAQGTKVPVVHFFRSPQYQQCLRDTATGDNPASRCGSPHVKGYAVDISSSDLTQKQY
ncbi:MAG: hypothetical protein ABIG66_02570, partial [Candidatus Kerfeldbacteria bacterium]